MLKHPHHSTRRQRLYHNKAPELQKVTKAKSQAQANEKCIPPSPDLIITQQTVN
jgi:hypothetical protein